MFFLFECFLHVHDVELSIEIFFKLDFVLDVIHAEGDFMSLLGGWEGAIVVLRNYIGVGVAFALEIDFGFYF